jgi:excinuclease ABC subunit A
MKETGFDLQTPLAKLTDEQWLCFWAGRGNEVLGLSNLLNKEYSTSRNGAYVEELGGFRRELTCQQCDGTRLGQAARNVFVAGQTIGKLNRLSISELLAWFKAIELSPAKKTIASELINEIERRLEFLIKVGLKYLSLERSTKTLSGGEFQRVRLAGAIGNGLNGVCYVLDEPSIGLHQRDNSKLIEAMRELQRNGNSLLVVEHDQEIMTQADWIIDIGPGAGDKGGEVVGASPPPALIEESNGVTAQYLSGRKKIEIPQRRAVSDAEQILIRGAAGFNLKKFDASIPLGVFVCVTGVSGSGKSTLINETLFPAVAAKLGLSTRQPQSHEAIEGIEKIDKLIQVDQAPIGRTPRGCLATHCGVLGEIRKIFAATRQAKQKGFTHSRFSFNSESGRCSECRGLGSIKLEVNFLPATYVTCPSCQGRRFNEQTLRILYRQKSIADVLEMEVTEAIEFFDAFSKIVEVLGCFERVGLGYISLGQPSTTLSGGEAQRIKLATELARRETGKTLYLLDEPTTGLHFEDIRRLLSVLQSLVDKGNSVIVIEHNLDVIKCADWVIDLGPDGGAAGGEIVGIGTPEMLAKNDRSYTGQYLKPMLG